MWLRDKDDSECNAPKDAHAHRRTNNANTCFHHLNRRQLQRMDGGGKRSWRVEDGSRQRRDGIQVEQGETPFGPELNG